jgi:hypothetical protein
MALRPPPSPVAEANRRIPFDTAMGWAARAAGTRARGVKASCPLCGSDGGIRAYPDHGYCFSERRRISVVTLLAEVWEMEREDAALRALDMYGYVPVTMAHLWEHAQRQPEVARAELAEALAVWCEANIPGWKTRQYEPVVSRKRSDCLALLPLVATEEGCRKWLAACKEAMRRVCSPG